MTPKPFVKLFQQDHLDTRKWFGTLAAVFAITVIISAALVATGWPIVQGLMLFIGIMVTALIIPAALGVLGYNYWQSMYGRRGYFTFSIPTAGKNLFLAKVAYAWVVTLVSMLAMTLAAGALAAAVALGNRESPAELFQQIWQLFPPIGTGWTIAIVAIMVGQVLLLVVNAAAIMSIGAQSRFSSLGFGAPVIGAIIFYVAAQLINLAALFLIPISVSVDGPNAGSIVWSGMLSNIGPTGEPTMIGLGTVLTALVVAAGMAAWATNAIERHTSLR